MVWSIRDVSRMFADSGEVISGEVIHGKFERLPPNAALIPANGHGKYHSKQLTKKPKVMYLMYQ